MSYKESPNLEVNDRDKQRAALLSMVVGILLLLIKFWAFNMTNSNAIFSDAMESIVNVVAGLLLIFVIYYASQPADTDHPYGHGKIEHFSAAFEGGLISFAALAILFDAARSLIQGHVLHEMGIGLAVVGFAGVVNLLLGLFLIREGKKQSSEAIQASGKHIVSDFWTSFGVVIGLALVTLTGWYWMDSVIAMIVAFFLGRTGLSIVRQSIGGLLDEESEEDLKNLAEIFSKHVSQSVIQIHHLKMIRSGAFHHIDAHLVVPEFWNVKDVHENIDDFEKNVVEDYPNNMELHFHLDPCRRAYCKVCDMPDCPIRLDAFEKRIPVSVKHFRSSEEPEEFRE
tara:strand:- start:221 stop:1240 length:1020 start_codon:yes stop_codon:yes gene_type:complete